MKHKGIFTTVVIITALAAVYAGMCLYFTSHMLPGNRISGVDAGGENASGISQILEDSASKYALDIKGEGTDDTLYGKDVSLTLDKDSVESAAKQMLSSQKVGRWPVAFFSKNEEVSIPRMSATYDTEALNKVIDSLSAVTATPKKSKNATYEATEDGVQIKKEVYGTEIDRDKLTGAIQNALSSLDDTLDLRESGCYKEPKIKSDNATLRKTVDTLDKYIAVDITYDFGRRGKVKVPKSEQLKWFKVSKSGKVTFDDDAMSDFAKMKLGFKYNTLGVTRKLKTQYGKTVTVKGGNYGWWINYAGEVAQLKKDIQAGKDVTREPVYHSKAANHGDSKYDYGKSYAEVNIATQHMFLVINGKKVLDSDVVTGKDVEGRRTPTGVYAITYKDKNATLRGQGYASPVSWWMPFNGNIGFHDAPWRHGKFGGDIYKLSGSHGCVNMPPEMAAKLWKYVKKGFPVIVYNQNETKKAREKAETQARK